MYPPNCNYNLKFLSHIYTFFILCFHRLNMNSEYLKAYPPCVVTVVLALYFEVVGNHIYLLEGSAMQTTQEKMADTLQLSRYTCIMHYFTTKKYCMNIICVYICILFFFINNAFCLYYISHQLYFHYHQN